jgi:tRNA(fMet)-specific endonuclease VapC
MYPEKNKEALFQFLLPLELVGFDSKASTVYGKVRSELEKAGKVIGAMDMLIASHALSIDATLVTNNEKEFRRIEGLKLANWAKV